MCVLCWLPPVRLLCLMMTTSLLWQEGSANVCRALVSSSTVAVAASCANTGPSEQTAPTRAQHVDCSIQAEGS
jgi:hypothetical protein